MEFNDDHTEINSVLGDLWMNAEKFCDDEAWEALCLLMDEYAICGFIFAVLKADSRYIDIRRSVLYNSLNDFGIALRKLEVQLGRAARKGGRRVKKAKKFSLLVMKFQDCMAHYRPNIGRGLDETIHLTCGIQWTHFNEWRKLLNPHLIDVSINFLYQKQECLSSNVKSCLEAIPEVILSLDLFLVEIIPTPIDGNFECNFLLNFVGAALIQAVHSIYSWSMVDFSDQNLVEQEKMANDLLKRLMPITPVTIDVFVNVLKASIKFKLWETKDAASHFVHLLIPSEEEGKGSSLVGVETIRKALVGLVSYLIYAPEIPVGKSEGMKEMLLIYIRHVACQFGSLRPLLYAKNEIVIKETGLALFKLLDKMEFLNLELLFLELEYLKVYLQKPPSLGLKRLIDQESVNRQRKQESLLRIDIQDLIDSLHEGLELLRSYPCQFSQVNNVRKMKRLWRHIEDLTRMAAFVLSTFDTGSITRTAVDEIRELQWKIKLLKIEVILMELLEGQSSLCVATREQVERFYEGIVFIRNFLMSPLDVDGKLILPRVEALAIVLDSRLFDGQGDLSLIRLQDFLPYLQKDIVLVKVMITESYQHIRSVSQSKFPKKSGFKFIDFILESIREQLGREFCTDNYAEHYIQVVYDEMEDIMKCFPRAVAEQHDEESDLNNLSEAIKSAALQAEYLIDSFAVRNGAVWYHVLWISDLIEELKVIKNQVFEISKNIPHISINNVEQPSTDVIWSPGVSNFGDIMVDLRDQATLIIDKLIAGSSYQDVVSIVGMPGLGKTTLAQKVFNDPSVTHYFHVRRAFFVGFFFPMLDVG